MDQLNWFSEMLPYRYIIDASSIFAQQQGEPHERRVHCSLWEYIEGLIQAQVIVTCSEIFEEIKDAKLQKWLVDNHCFVIGIDETVQDNVAQVLAKHPRLIDFKNGTSSGDAFLIATAMKHNLTIITEESTKSDKRIPHVAASMGIHTVNINGLCSEEGRNF